VTRIVLTADQVLYEGDVISRSDGFGTIATIIIIIIIIIIIKRNI